MSTYPLPKEPTESFPYRIEREAGRGAMGVVYRAVEPLLDRPVAIKVLKTDEGKDSESHQRFLQEARAAAGLAHPGVTTVYRVGELGGSPYLVMEWLDGPTLEELVDDQGPQSLEDAVRLVVELLDVLGEAHDAGVVHRDLKPSNMVVLQNGRLKVMDFGIALLQGRKLVETMVGTVLATPQFASPEQLQGESLDGRSDLFSATLLFYFLLTGKLPFEAKHLGELLSAVITGTPTPIAEHRRELGSDVQAFLDRGLAKVAADRFPDARFMAEALRRLSPPTDGSSVNLLAATTHMVTPPKHLIQEIGIASPWRAVQAVIETWPAKDLGKKPLTPSLEKLLEKPFHTNAFAGAALFDKTCLLIADGVVQGAIDTADGTLDCTAEFPDEASIRLFTAPAEEAVVVQALAGMLSPGPAVHEGLDTELVNLPALISRQLDEGFSGHLRLEGEGSLAYVLFTAAGSPLAVLGGGWASVDHENWSRWLGTVRAKASVFPTRNHPPASWYRLGYGNTEISVHSLKAHEGSARGTGALESFVDTAAHRAGTRFFQLRSEGGTAAVPGAPLEHSPVRRFLAWMFDQLPYDLTERKKTGAWKYLGDWLLEVHKARLYTDLERPGSGTKDAFDLVTEDKDGKVLHVAQRFAKVDGDTLKAFVDQVRAAKEARLQTGDIGGVIVLSPRFEPSTDETYRQLPHQGIGNRLFGIDRSMGYDGFVRMSARRGFHLLLVEENGGDSFRPRFEV